MGPLSVVASCTASLSCGVGERHVERGRIVDERGAKGDGGLTVEFCWDGAFKKLLARSVPKRQVQDL
jgi:hypothetical protein